MFGQKSEHLMLLIFQILNLCYNKDDVADKVQLVIDRFAERGLRSLAVAYQVVLICNSDLFTSRRNSAI